MKKKLHLSRLLTAVLCISVFSVSITTVRAEDTEDTDEITLKTIDEYKDIIDASGYEDWQPNSNPKLREMYGGYNRNGSFYIWKKSTNQVFMANNFNVKWKNGGGVSLYYYVPGVGTIEKTSDYEVREISSANGLFELKGDCSVWKHPTSLTQWTGETLPKGTYTITRQALEYVELVKPNGVKVWVAPQFSNKDQAAFYTNNYGKFVNAKDTLSVSSVNGKSIKQWLMPVRADKRTGIAMQPKYVTIHNTGSPGRGANAYVHAKNQIHDSRTWVSWHYTVDNNEIYQSIPMSEIAYHAGDGQNIGNSATIGIEICENSDGNYAQAEKNAAYLTAQILYENNLPADAVRMHKDWSGKQCAKNILEGTKGTMGWNGFKNLVKQEYDCLVFANSMNTTIPETFAPIMTKSGLKFETGIVSGVPFESSLQALVDKFKVADGSVVVGIEKSGISIPLGTKVATGQMVVMSKGEETFKFQLAIKGDTNGDGKISSLDYSFVKNQILKVSSLSGAFNRAADINKDGKISSLDYSYIKNHILNISLITQ